MSIGCVNISKYFKNNRISYVTHKTHQIFYCVRVYSIEIDVQFANMIVDSFKIFTNKQIMCYLRIYKGVPLRTPKKNGAVIVCRSVYDIYFVISVTLPFT